MSDEQFSSTFWLGNAILGVAMVFLLFFGSAWESLGVTAMVVWVGMVGLGVYLIMQKKDGA